MPTTYPKEPIAIIGVGCRFPGGANTPQLFWQVLRHGADVITDIPSSRWNVDEYYDPNPDTPGKIYVRGCKPKIGHIISCAFAQNSP